MADPLSVVASLTGIAAASVQLTNAVLTLVDSMRNADKLLSDLSEELETLKSIITPVANLAFSESKDMPISKALKNCQKSLKDLEQLIESINQKNKLNKKNRSKFSQKVSNVKLTAAKGITVFMSKAEITDSINKLRIHENRVGMAILATFYTHVTFHLFDDIVLTDKLILGACSRGKHITVAQRLHMCKRLHTPMISALSR